MPTASKMIEKVGVGHTHDSKRSQRDSKTSKANLSEAKTRKVVIEQLSLF